MISLSSFFPFVLFSGPFLSKAAILRLLYIYIFFVLYMKIPSTKLTKVKSHLSITITLYKMFSIKHLFISLKRLLGLKVFPKYGFLLHCQSTRLGFFNFSVLLCLSSHDSELIGKNTFETK